MAILWATFLLTDFSDLVVAVGVGVALAAVHFLRRMADSFEVQLTAPLDDHAVVPPGVGVFSIDGPSNGPWPRPTPPPAP